MPIDINGAINAIVSDDFPEYTVLLGIGPYVEENLLDETKFYDVQIEDKMNAIQTAKITFLNKTEDDLQDVEIRIYLDGKKKFAGYIKKCSATTQTNELTCDCIGLADYITRYVIKDISDNYDIKSVQLIANELSIPGWTIDIDGACNNFPLNYRLEKGNKLQHLNNLCILNYWEWYVDDVDSETGLSTRYLRIKPHRGLESPSQTFYLESSAYNAILDKDKDKLKNVVLTSGSSSQASNLATTAMGFFPMGDEETPTEMGYVIGSESWLREPVMVGATELKLESVSGYPTPGTYKVQIDSERVEYDEVDLDNRKLILTDPTTMGHEPGAAVLNISLLRAYLPPTFSGSQSVWIGNERIYFTSMDYWGLHDIERGKLYLGEATPKYPHGEGTKIFSGSHLPDDPATTSSVGTWGRSDSRVSDIGSIDRDGLDKYGTAILLNSQKYEPFGTFNCTVEELKTLVVGDAFYIQEKGSDEKVLRRCTGLYYDDDIVTIAFGMNENYILNQFDNVERIDNNTYVKQDLDESTEVDGVSADGKSVRIKLADGTTKWVPVR